MTWNPCGHIVAWGSRPYTTTARPFRNSNRTVKIVWYPAHPNAPVLPFASALNSLDDQEQRLWMEDQEHNEDPTAPRSYNARKPPQIAPTGHLCGTREDFERGGLYSPDDVPPPVDLAGIPLCCNPGIVPVGGGVGGGVMTPGTVDVSAGGESWGGDAPEFIAYADSGEGGTSWGGDAPESYTPGSPAGGTDCNTAGVLSIATPYSLTIPAGAGFVWWKYVTTVTSVHHVELANWTNAVEMTWWTGFACFAMGATKVYVADGCQSSLVAASRIIAFAFEQDPTLTQTVDLEFDVGPC